MPNPTSRSLLGQLRSELSYVGHMVRLNLASLMEYRASFLTQAVGMFINNGIYFVFWLLFFDRFGAIRGYQITQIYMLFAIVAFGWGIAFTLAGNANRLAEMIATGRLDYYLTLPRPVLPHLLFSSMNAFAIGDLTFGVIAFLFTGRYDVLSVLLFVTCSVLAAVIIVSFRALTGCLAFFLGNAQEWSFYLANSLVTFALYPLGLFQGMVRLVLFTLIPAAFIGGIPVEIVETHSLVLLAGLGGVAALSVLVLGIVFRIGMRRYESGSAIHVNI